MFGKVSSLLINGPPNDGESFVGFLIRMAEWNKHEWLSWILQRIKIISGKVLWIPSFAFNDSADLATLAELTDTKIAELKSLLYLPVAGSGFRHLIFGKPLPQYVIRPSSPKICPSCLRESNYYRKIWDLAPVTACPIHECRILETCPNCTKRIPWNRNKVSVCRCGYDWRETASCSIEDGELGLSRQIYLLCGCSIGNGDVSNQRLPNPLLALELEDILSAVVFIAGQYQGITSVTGKRLFPSKRNESFHTPLVKAFATFEDWPHRYYRFLDWKREHNKEDKPGTGLAKDFGDFHHALYERLHSKHLDFMRIEYEDYLCSRWDGGILCSHSLRLSKAGLRNKKFLSKNQVVDFLRIPEKWIDRLITEDILHPVIHNRPNNKLMIFDVSEAEKAEHYLKQLLTLKDVGKILNIEWQSLRSLVDKECLVPAYGPNAGGYKFRLFQKVEVEQLLSEIESRIVDPPTEQSKLLSLKEAVFRISMTGIDIGSLVRAILDRKISPCGKTARKGLDQFVFAEEHVEKYIENLRRDLKGKSISIEEAARIIGVSKRNVYAFIKKGLLTASKICIDKGLSIRTTEEEVSLFNSTYLLPAKIKKDLGTSSKFIVDVLSKKGILPVSGPTIGGEEQYVFKRSHLEHINLTGVVNHAKCKGDPRGKQYSIINGEQAAEFLGVYITDLQEMVESSKLKPYSTQLHSSGRISYLFYHEDVQGYKDATTDYSKLVSMKEAAEIFGQGYDSFINQWVKTKRLVPASLKYECNQYCFLREDVVSLALIKKNTITSRGAAAILGVDKKAVHRLTTAGKLKPFSGPHVDRYGHNIYLRSDVERLAEEVARLKRAGLISSPEAGKLLGVNRGTIHQWTLSGKLKPVSGPHIDDCYKNMYRRDDIVKMKEKIEQTKLQKLTDAS
jgi:predicted site-specific integrase-resolvase